MLMVIVPVSLLTLGFYYKTEEAGDDLLIKVVMENLRQMHYQPVDVNDDFSKMAWEDYLENLDPNKRFLLKSDVQDLKAYQTKIDDETQEGTYEFFNRSLQLIDERTKMVQGFYREILSKPFDFTVDETVEFGEKMDYSKSEKDLKDRWRKYLKYNVMTRLASSLDVNDQAQSAQTEMPPGTEDTENVMDVVEEEKADISEAGTKTFAELEEDARKAVLKSHDEWFQRIDRLDRKDRLAGYVNTLTALFDPHTNYFPPADKDNFDIRMSGKLEGIGAQLQEKDGYIKVVSIVPGSPSALQGELQANDLILKVAQGTDEAVDIVNARIDDAVKIIRGKKGTEVRLTVQKPDGHIKVIPIVRDVIVLEETYAKSAIIHDADNLNVGYLYLPSFYADFNDRNGRTCSKDVKEELRKLKKDKADVLILDLRNNGGGSLPDVVDMAGLFIPKGPIVQAKSRHGDPYIMSDHNNSVEWDKPVIIMVNEFSASASEILAAALQDYRRAVIVGSHTTHGKGTVQRFVELNQTLRNNNYDDMGALKLTTQKFYRINGGTTQLNGVTPDIIWPDNYTYIKTGEREQKHALNFDKIQPADYKPFPDLFDLSKLRSQSEKRTSGNDLFKAIDENARRWKAQSEEETYTLVLEKYRAEQKARKEVNDAYSKLFKPYDDVAVATLSEDLVDIQSDSLKQKRADNWHASMKKDIYLYESLQIAEDLYKQDRRRLTSGDR